MDQPKAPPKLDLTHVNFYSFSGDPRPEKVCKKENASNTEDRAGTPDEGFSVLVSALRRTQVGAAAQTFATNRNHSAHKCEANQKPKEKSA